MLRELSVAVLAVSSCLAHPTIDLNERARSEIEWAPCDLDFDPNTQKAIEAHGQPIFCTTLSVPLDYTEPSNGRELELQLIKVQATKQPYKGSILTNPGGPGGSGVQYIAVEGPSIRDDFGGYHDVIGFDPR